MVVLHSTSTSATASASHPRTCNSSRHDAVDISARRSVFRPSSNSRRRSVGLRAARIALCANIVAACGTDALSAFSSALIAAALTPAVEPCRTPTSSVTSDVCLSFTSASSPVATPHLHDPCGFTAPSLSSPPSAGLYACPTLEDDGNAGGTAAALAKLNTSPARVAVLPGTDTDTDVHGDGGSADLILSRWLRGRLCTNGSIQVE
jgi:hypothetical protein